MLEFRVMPGSPVPYRLRIYSPAADILREIAFDRDGWREGDDLQERRASRLGGLLRRTRTSIVSRQGPLLRPLAHRLLARLISPRKRRRISAQSADDRDRYDQRP